MKNDNVEILARVRGARARNPNQRPHDFTRFDVLMDTFQAWRNADHHDNIVICRSDIITIIEGVKAMTR